MGKIIAGPWAPFHGKVGNIVGQIYDGMNVIKQYQPVVRNPRTTKQELVRKKFMYLVDSWRWFRNGALLGLSTASSRERKSAFALFMKKNWQAMSGSEPDNISMEMANVIVATGTFPGIIPSGQPTSEDPGAISIRWNTLDDEPGSDDFDTVYILCVDPEGKYSALFMYNRNNHSADMDLPAYMTGHSICIYGFTQSHDDPTKFSDSVYFGKTTLS